ncbi:hypothetical protein ACFLSJ_00560 [Verrucomicrobiota bacterium]
MASENASLPDRFYFAIMIRVDERDVDWAPKSGHVEFVAADE